MEKTKFDTIKEFLSKIYVPVTKKDEFMRMMNFLASVYLRSFNSADAGKIGYSVIRIITKARGTHETFESWQVRRCDVWDVTKHFVTFALYDSDNNAMPFKAKLNNPRFAIIY